MSVRVEEPTVSWTGKMYANVKSQGSDLRATIWIPYLAATAVTRSISSGVTGAGRAEQSATLTAAPEWFPSGRRDEIEHPRAVSVPRFLKECTTPRGTLMKHPNPLEAFVFSVEASRIEHIHPLLRGCERRGGGPAPGGTTPSKTV